jgi:hypothetical protein
VSDDLVIVEPEETKGVQVYKYLYAYVMHYTAQASYHYHYLPFCSPVRALSKLGCNPVGLRVRTAGVA